MTQIKWLPGLILCLLLALAARALAQLSWPQNHALSALTLAILLGALAGNLLHPRRYGRFNTGIGFAKQRLLQLGIMLYGLRISLTDLTQVGLKGLTIDVLVLTSTFALAWFLGTRLFKLDLPSVILIGAGSSICGAAAIMATEPVIKSKAEQVSVAVATVLIFGSLSMLLYPLVYDWNLHAQWLPLTSQRAGLFTGSTVHEVAQVVAAAKVMGDSASHTAVIEKMGRVLMLAPFLLALSIVWRKRNHSDPGAQPGAIHIPWFAVMFVLVIVLHSVVPINAQLQQTLVQLDDLLLALAMAALGLCTRWVDIRRAGLKPLLLAGLLFSWLILGGGAINLLLG